MSESLDSVLAVRVGANEPCSSVVGHAFTYFSLFRIFAFKIRLSWYHRPQLPSCPTRFVRWSRILAISAERGRRDERALNICALTGKKCSLNLR